MSSSSGRMFVRIYGKVARRESVQGVVKAIFGSCHTADWHGPHSEDACLAELRFDWPAGIPVEWVADLSTRLPAETFEVFDCSSDPAAAAREVFRAGQRADGWVSPSQQWPLGSLAPAVPVRGPLDLVAIAMTKLDECNSYYTEAAESGIGIAWDDRFTLDELRSDIAAIESLLTPAEQSRLEAYESGQRRATEELVARRQARGCLETATQLLLSPAISVLLDDEDREAVDRLSRIIAKAVPDC